jgi:hypothetical protein
MKRHKSVQGLDHGLANRGITFDSRENQDICFSQGISGFLDFIHRPVFEGTRRFGNWICFRPQVKGGKKTTTQLGLLVEISSF